MEHTKAEKIEHGQTTIRNDFSIQDVRRPSQENISKLNSFEQLSIISATLTER